MRPVIWERDWPGFGESYKESEKSFCEAFYEVFIWRRGVKTLSKIGEAPFETFSL